MFVLQAPRDDIIGLSTNNFDMDLFSRNRMNLKNYLFLTYDDVTMYIGV